MVACSCDTSLCMAFPYSSLVLGQVSLVCLMSLETIYVLLPDLFYLFPLIFAGILEWLTPVMVPIKVTCILVLGVISCSYSYRLRFGEPDDTLCPLVPRNKSFVLYSTRWTITPSTLVNKPFTFCYSS